MIPKGLIDLATQTKVTVPVILVLAVGYLGWRADDFSVTYLDRFFITEVEAQETTQAIDKLSSEVKQIGSTLENYIGRQDVIRINSELAQTANDIRVLEREIQADGSTPLRERQLEELLGRQQQLVSQKRCLLDESVTDKTNCDLQ